MDDPSETAASATAQPGSQPLPQPDETLVLTVDEAADLLAISPQAVRKRIAKGTLPARRDGRAWRVFLDRATVETDAPETGHPLPQPRAHPPAPAAQPQAAQLAALVEPFTTPLVARIEALSREAERERGRGDAAEAERDEARAEVGRLRAARDAPEAHQVAPGAAEPAGAVSPPSRPWWRRLWGRSA